MTYKYETPQAAIRTATKIWEYIVLHDCLKFQAYDALGIAKDDRSDCPLCQYTVERSKNNSTDCKKCPVKNWDNPTSEGQVCWGDTGPYGKWHTNPSRTAAMRVLKCIKRADVSSKISERAKYVFQSVGIETKGCKLYNEKRKDGRRLKWYGMQVPASAAGQLAAKLKEEFGQLLVDVTYYKNAIGVRSLSIKITGEISNE